jgi:hypothetical protein
LTDKVQRGLQAFILEISAIDERTGPLLAHGEHLAEGL